MIPKDLFKKPQNALENTARRSQMAVGIPDEMCTLCPSCKKTIFNGELSDNMRVCPFCGYNFRVKARRRIDYMCDRRTFSELDCDIKSRNRIDFPGYDEKLSRAAIDSGENDAVVCGSGKINGRRCAIFAMDAYFMMGSMGAAVGEKLTRLFEYAAAESIPVLGFTLSGGARMQEGIISLMQMAKVSAAVKRHSDGGNLYVSVLCDPTMGGVTASFAMLADIILAEPNALIGFAGPRVIEQTIRQKLPAGFQRAEFLLEHGFIDEIVERKNQKEYVSKLLRFHSVERT